MMTDESAPDHRSIRTEEGKAERVDSNDRKIIPRKEKIEPYKYKNEHGGSTLSELKYSRPNPFFSQDASLRSRPIVTASRHCCSMHKRDIGERRVRNFIGCVWKKNTPEYNTTRHWMLILSQFNTLFPQMRLEGLRTSQTNSQPVKNNRSPFHVIFKMFPRTPCDAVTYPIPPLENQWSSLAYLSSPIYQLSSQTPHLPCFHSPCQTPFLSPPTLITTQTHQHIFLLRLTIRGSFHSCVALLRA